MHAYFKPLRRKLGVCTLVIACVLLTSWVRSERSLSVRSEASLSFNFVSMVHSCGERLLLREAW